MGRSSRGRDRDEGGLGQALVFALGAAGGLAAGLFLSGRQAAEETDSGVRGRLRERARDVAHTLRPARLRRELVDQLELTRQEDAVLDAFLRDPVLSERPIDVGAISQGIVELSGTVHSAGEAEHAMRVAQRVHGVETVVNRMDVEDEGVRRGRSDDTEATGGRMSGEWTGRNIGMGQRRQGEETEPGTNDDSRHQKEVALEAADRAQFEDEELAHSQPRMSSRPGTGMPELNYSEDELDNQSPYGKHAVPVPEQPQAMNSAARVGEGLKPGTELMLEQADVPVKPHGDRPRTDPDES
ncbi:MAG TPA: BON domain-containing protein [Longimicrobium sp.]|nr:BON domain-containing protein [Longimicrobium sp.]